MKTEQEKDTVNILVVEDSRTQAEYLQHILEQQGYRVILAFDGNQALELIKTERPAIVLTDIIMPEMDGYALCSAIKHDKDMADIPVILVTQLFDPPDLIKGLEAGANDIIIKPFQPEHVLSRVASVLQSQAQKKSGDTSPALEVSFDGKTHLIPESQLRTPAIILSSYDAAMRKNAELQESSERLALLNEELEKKVEKLQQVNEQLRLSPALGNEEHGEKIRESEDRFRLITERSPFPISIIDSAGKNQYVNKKFEQLFGYTLGDIPTGKDWLQKAFPDITERTKAINTWKQGRGQEAWNEGNSPIFPVTCKDGTIRQIRYCPIPLKGGEQCVIYEDLTDKVESERLRSVLVSIVNSSNDAIIGKSLDGTILSWNKAAERYYGYLAEEVIGKSIEIIMPPETRVHLPVFLRRVGAGETIDRFDTVRLRKDGSRIAVSVTISPIRNEEGRIVGISTIAQNIADREKSETSRMFREQVLHRR
ncbi:PAS domain S-box protein [Methanoregula sp. PtaB.Bin085]|uniref:PAS domain S-box protein n=1 Tax=Methanoregula sp. PtaB.Bin085 TaxID=1811680 RepID=UPI0009CEC115|nr:PAS domain S-box protein [Methanoregula sp. PtaB.Bin085]OPX62325.1 MAG: response regulator PleD [Methanoregula sp. PtaB.Bin085]